jgi:hypothetical protein
MFTTGSKLFFGLSAIAVLSAVIHGITSGDLAGIIILLSFATVAGFLGGITSFARDGEVRLGSGGVAAVPAARHVGSSPWPLLGGVSIALIGIGLVYDRVVFGVGIVLLIGTIVEWMIQNWSDRASADPAYNARVRGRVAHPFEFPILATAVIGLMMFAFSRILLSLSETPAIVVFTGMAILVLLVGVFLASRSHVSRNLLTAIGVGFVALMTASAVVGISRGEKEHHEKEEPNRAVAAKSNTFATVRASERGIEITHDDRTMEKIVLPRGVDASLLFRNDSGEHARLVVETLAVETDAEGNAKTVPAEFHTEEIKSGHAKMLTVRMNKPGTFKLIVEGEAGEVGEREVEVLA